MIWLFRFIFLGALYYFIWMVIKQLSAGIWVPEARTGAPGEQPRREPRANGRTGRVPAKLVLPEGPGKTKVWVKTRGKAGGRSTLGPGGVLPLRRRLTFGRARANDVLVEDPFASSKHAVVYLDQAGYWVRDLGSTNGTLVNGRRARGPVRLRSGDALQLGETMFSFRDGGGAFDEGRGQE